MYKILWMIFGWDYIFWSNSAGQGIARVRRFPSGKLWYWRYWGTRVMDTIHSADQVEWLTCDPEKYFPKRKGE